MYRISHVSSFRFVESMWVYLYNYMPCLILYTCVLSGKLVNYLIFTYRGERFINCSVVSSLGMSTNPVTKEAFKESKVLWWSLLWSGPLCNRLGYYFLGDCERILNRTHHNTSGSIKASIMAGFADIEAFRESKVLLGSCGWSAPSATLDKKKTARESSTGPTITLRTPWRPLWSPHSRTWSLPKGPEGEYARLVPLLALESSTSPRQRMASSIFLLYPLLCIFFM